MEMAMTVTMRARTPIPIRIQYSVFRPAKHQICDQTCCRNNETEFFAYLLWFSKYFTRMYISCDFDFPIARSAKRKARKIKWVSPKGPSSSSRFGASVVGTEIRTQEKSVSLNAKKQPRCLVSQACVMHLTPSQQKSTKVHKTQPVSYLCAKFVSKTFSFCLLWQWVCIQFKVPELVEQSRYILDG